MKLIKLTTIFAVIPAFFLFSCNSSNSTDNSNSSSSSTAASEVIIHELSDADMLNPYNYQGEGAGYIFPSIFQPLLGIDFKSLELVPVLAKSRPEIEKTPEGGMRITYHIRPEAKWDNGQAITVKDIEFSLKVIKNPKVNNERLKPYYEFIKDIKFYEGDPLKFTFICSNVYILAEAASGDFSIIPEAIYDPKGLMKDFSIPQLNTQKDVLMNDPKITEFANDFNSERYQREKEFING